MHIQYSQPSTPLILIMNRRIISSNFNKMTDHIYESQIIPNSTALKDLFNQNIISTFGGLFLSNSYLLDCFINLLLH